MQVLYLLSPMGFVALCHFNSVDDLKDLGLLGGHKTTTVANSQTLVQISYFANLLGWLPKLLSLKILCCSFFSGCIFNNIFYMIHRQC